jgi:hypothetical protein
MSVKGVEEEKGNRRAILEFPLNVIIFRWICPFTVLEGTLIKNKTKFSSYIGNFYGIGCKDIYEEMHKYFYHIGGRWSL